ncbi:DHHC palmitoyltransferase-domain-containing protein, partial [Zychaea mexicana]|uniref:DHHC palmitoyltransferase-domain-containing protein n=1 Tax=Zychaea mexicana TaxID=64656 RepID=UPI0022FE6B7E
MLDSIPGRVFVVGVSLLIATIAYSSQAFIFLPAMGWWSIKAAKSLIPFNLLVLMIYYNYYLACTTDPGPVPQGWEPPYSTLQPQEGLSATDTGITGPRYCKSCKVYKPPRTHHCRYCRRCVLKMDHHCPWIANCVGHDNYPHFIRFILFVDIACSYALGLLVWRVRSIMNDIRHFRPTTTEIVFLVLNFILAFVVLFCVGILSIYHMYCMSRNQSSVESWERSKVNTLIKRGKILPIKYPFDVGFYRNICSVLGNNPLTWLWPKKPTSDGLVFP